MKKEMLYPFLILASLSACGPRKQPNIEIVQNMMDTPAVKAQAFDPSQPDGRAMRIPPANTVPRGFEPYPYQDPDTAGKELKNPIAMSEESTKRGQELFFTYCSVCHGATGGGDGPVAAKFVMKPPALTTQKARDFADGYLYHMISRGRGLMGSYANQIPYPNDRWALVNYLRQLQKNSPVAN